MCVDGRKSIFAKTSLDENRVFFTFSIVFWDDRTRARIRICRRSADRSFLSGIIARTFCKVLHTAF